MPELSLDQSPHAQVIYPPNRHPRLGRPGPEQLYPSNYRLSETIMASSSFRDSMNSLGWSRRDPDVPVTTAQQTGLLSSIKSLNPFGDGGYVRLPTVEGAGAPLPARTRREEEEGWFACESAIPHSSTFHCPCVSQPHGPCATCSNSG